LPHQTTPLLYDTLADVQDLAATRDPVVRNLRITQSYYDISKAPFSAEQVEAIRQGVIPGGQL
jgi:hypothetical protein